MRPLHAIALVGCAALLTSCTPPAAASTAATVVAVVDGDTIDVETPDGEQRVRLIGIDTPEISHDGGADQCHAQEARDYLNQLLYGRDVELVSDPTQADEDRYGRLLRHVLVDGENAALSALTAGAGTEYTYDVPYRGQGAHKAAQDKAAAAEAGLWSACE